MFPPALSRIIEDARTFQCLSSRSSSRIQNKIKQVNDSTGRSSMRIHGQNRSHTISLPPPSPMLNLLLDKGVPHDIAKALSQAFVLKGTQLRQKTEITMRSAITSECDETISHQTYSAFLKLYQQTLKDWEAKTLASAVARLNGQRAPAKKSHTPAVIKPHSPQTSKLCTVDTLGTTRDVLSSSNPNYLRTLPNQIETHAHEDHSPLTRPGAPPHAFPAIYPPPVNSELSNKYIPLTAFLPTWRRPSRPATTCETVKIDMDSFTTLFSTKLVITASDVNNISQSSSVDMEKTSQSADPVNSADSQWTSLCIPTMTPSQRNPKPVYNINTQCKGSADVQSMQLSRNKMSVDDQIILDSSSEPRNFDSSCISPPFRSSLHTVFPPSLTFSNKISGLLRQPALPVLDITSPTTVPDTFLKSPSNISSHLASVISHSPRSSKSRKIAPLPRRVPRSVKKSSPTRSNASSALGRTPSLSSISSCGPSTSRSNHAPF